MLPECKEVLLSLNGSVLTATFNRAHKRNAMNTTLVDELMAIFDSIKDDRTIRAIVLQGSEGNFCAGGDVSGMNKASQTKDEANQALWNFNRSFGHLIAKVNSAPQVVITLLEGAVMGGGFGLACISDVAITDENAMFALPETSLGIIPAQIAPFVVTRIGLTQARRLALLGERINGKQAQLLGITHFVTDSNEAMKETLAKVLKQVNRCGPEAIASTKLLLLKVGNVELDPLLDQAADMFSTSLNSAEGQEGTQAFLQKRKPNWC
ncbi:MAG: enoyl-CoA hydratase/isomerase family protein [Alteromonadales bacterium]|nr:enoyl-CoA hydratase/isomerase family protein [Alteromonadales bacterium]